MLCSFSNFKSGDLWLALITFLYVSTLPSLLTGRGCFSFMSHVLDLYQQTVL